MIIKDDAQYYAKPPYIVRYDKKNHKTYIMKLVSDNMIRDIENISYKDFIYKIRLRNYTPHNINNYDAVIYLNNEIEVLENGTIINPLRSIREIIGENFQKNGNEFIESYDSGYLFLVRDFQLYNTGFSFKDYKATPRDSVEIDVDGEYAYFKYSDNIVKKKLGKTRYTTADTLDKLWEIADINTDKEMHYYKSGDVPDLK